MQLIPMIYRRLLPWGLLPALLLAGCVAPLPEMLKTKPAEQPQPVSPVPEAELAKAGELAAAGDHGAAAALYQGLAMRVPAPYRQDLQLQAAGQYLLAQDTESAEGLLAQTDIEGLPPLFGLRKRMLASDLAVRKGRLRDALSLLEQIPPEDAPVDLRQRYHRQRAEIFRLEGNLLESARELELLDLLISDKEARLRNQQAIVQTLATLTDGALRMLQPDPPGVQGGWMELARIIKGYAGDPDHSQALAAAWRKRFPGHPALPGLLEGYFQRLQAQYRRPTHLALLLPRSGPLAEAADALRDGFMAAYYQQPQARRPRLNFFDSSNVEDTWPLYRQAVEAGADMVIGPLHKDAVSQLARAGELEIPVLALNQIPPQVRPQENFYQFGLPPEDEARQVAERAWLDGLGRALVFTPGSDWGERIQGSFRDRWESLGGVLLEQRTYSPRGGDYSGPIRALLHIDASKNRRRELQRILGRKVKFEPCRRQDADFIFFAAKPRAARQIRPLLQFHRAADLPVYATSHAYAGRPDADKDRDLEGLKFPDMPWLLLSGADDSLSQEALAAVFPNARLRYQRLYAMGIDSFNLLPHLRRLKTSPWETLDGQTGNLYLDGINQVHRRLVWAQIRKGLPRVLGYAPRIESDLMAPGDGLPPLMLRPAPAPAGAPATTPEPGPAPAAGDRT